MDTGTNAYFILRGLLIQFKVGYMKNKSLEGSGVFWKSMVRAGIMTPDEFKFVFVNKNVIA